MQLQAPEGSNNGNRPGTADMPVCPLDKFESMQDGGLVLLTSGSTSLPKFVPLNTDRVLAGAFNVVRSLQLDENDTCCNALPLFHVGGLIDLLLAPLLSGGTIYFARHASASSLLQAVVEERATWLQLVPTMLAALSRELDALDRPQSLQHIRFIRSVSAPLPDKLKTDFEAAHGVPVVEIFGMTETSGVITSAPLRANYKPGSTGSAVGNNAVCIVDDDGNPLAPGEVGHVEARGPGIMEGYLAEDLSRDSVFRGDWLKTGDLGYLDHDGDLFLTGRTKEVINRGGEKISPQEIDGVLSQHPAIADAGSYARPHETLGEDVALAVVLRESAAISAKEIRRFLAARLARHKVPSNVTFLDALPRTKGGKLQRHLLEAACRDHRETKIKFHSSADLAELEDGDVLTAAVARAWADILEVDSVGPDDDFFELGGDSLKATSFFSSFFDNDEVPIAVLYDARTLREFVNYLNNQDQAEVIASLTQREQRRAFVVREIEKRTVAWRGTPIGRNAILRQLTPGNEPVQLFSVVNYFFECERFVEQIGWPGTVYAMSSMHRGSHNTDDNKDVLAEIYAEDIAALAAGEPIAIWGHCEAGRIAQRIAGRLAALGREDVYLFLTEMYEARPCTVETEIFFSSKQYRNVDKAWNQRKFGHGRAYPPSLSITRYNQPPAQYFGARPGRLFAHHFRQSLERKLGRAFCADTPPSSGKRMPGTIQLVRALPKTRVAWSKAGVYVDVKFDVAIEIDTAIGDHWFVVIQGKCTAKPDQTLYHLEQFRIDETDGGRKRIGAAVHLPAASGVWSFTASVVEAATLGARPSTSEQDITLGTTRVLRMGLLT
jgi:hypothetical protein